MLRADWITIEEAMERTRRGKSTIYRWINQGDVKTYRPGKTVLLLAADVDEAERVNAERIGKKKPRKTPSDTP